jgi:ribonucleoside-triphosphate reductase (formate)
MTNKKQLFNKLSDSQINKKIDFINSYIKAKNSAQGSIVDPNSNVSEKNMGTLEAELYKYENVQVNRAIVSKKIKELFGEDISNEYNKDIESHLIYIHDETSPKPYCASVTMYPYLLYGTKCLGGTSKAPKNLQSFCGSFVNLVYQLASNWSGATATVEFLMYFDYFARLEYGSDYLESHKHEIEQEFQGVVYALNQPAAARGK